MAETNTWVENSNDLWCKDCGAQVKLCDGCGEKLKAGDDMLCDDGKHYCENCAGKMIEA